MRKLLLVQITLLSASHITDRRRLNKTEDPCGAEGRQEAPRPRVKDIDTYLSQLEFEAGGLSLGYQSEDTNTN